MSNETERAIVEEVEICNCTNEQLARARGDLRARLLSECA